TVRTRESNLRTVLMYGILKCNPGGMSARTISPNCSITARSVWRTTNREFDTTVISKKITTPNTVFFIIGLLALVPVALVHLNLRIGCSVHDQPGRSAHAAAGCLIAD